MPPTVIVPPFDTAPCVAAGVVDVAAEPLPLVPAFAPELDFEPPDLVGAVAFVFAPELIFDAGALWTTGVAPLLCTCAPDVPPLVPGAAVPDVAPLLGAAVPETPAGAAVYACPATACCTGVALW